MLKPIGFFVSVKNNFLKCVQNIFEKEQWKTVRSDVSDPLLPNR